MTKLLLILTAAVSVLIVSARSLPEKAPLRTQPGPPRESRLSRHIWRAFGELSDAERKEMMQLQRENPDKFLEVMKKKAEEFFNAEKAERQLLTDLVQKYQAEKNKSDKEKIKKQISEILAKRFNKRLALNRKHIESMKKRTQMLEKELDERAANSEKIIKVQLDAILEGKELRPPRRPPHRGPKPPAKSPVK